MAREEGGLAQHIQWGFFLALCVLAAMAGLTLTLRSHFQTMQGVVKAVDENLTLLRNAQNAVEEIHSARRLDQDEFKAVVREMRPRALGDLKSLALRVAGNPLQARRIESLRQQIQTMLRRMTSGGGAALVGLEQDLDEIRADFADLEEVESAILKERLRQTHASSWQGFALSLGGIAFSFIVVLIATLVVIADRRALKLAKEFAVSASQAKSDFLSSVSHEIRTPLNSILGMAEVLAETKLDHDQRKYVQVFRNAGKTLLHLINDILDLSKIEAGKLELSEGTFSLSQAVLGVTELMTFRASAKNLFLKQEIDPAVPDGLVGDVDRVRQVLTNLVGNAVKFTDTGGVTVRVRALPGGVAEAPAVEFSIVDTGIGIPESKQAAVFGKFNQLDRSVSKKYGGTGLGLSISKQLVELMGGRIGFESAAGRGTRFYFVLPLKATGAAVTLEQSAETKPPAPLRILIADDHEDNRFLLQSYFKDTPHELVLVADGRPAVEEATRSPFDVILMDLNMPGLDGLSATREIRAWEKANGRIDAEGTPIFALTANALRSEQERCREAGCTLHLTKPISKDDLFQALLGVTPRVLQARRGTTRLRALPTIAPELQDLVPHYLENRWKDLELAREALKRGELDKIRTIGHNAKGTAASYGFGRLGEIGSQLESAAKAGDLGNVTKWLAAYEEELSTYLRQAAA